MPPHLHASAPPCPYALPLPLAHGYNANAYTHTHPTNTPTSVPPCLHACIHPHPQLRPHPQSHQSSHPRCACAQADSTLAAFTRVETLCLTPAGYSLALLTIAVDVERTERLGQGGAGGKAGDGEERAAGEVGGRSADSRTAVVVMARTHPGESTSSMVMEVEKPPLPNKAQPTSLFFCRWKGLPSRTRHSLPPSFSAGRDRLFDRE